MNPCVEADFDLLCQAARDRAHAGYPDKALSRTYLVDALVVGEGDDAAAPAAHKTPVDPALGDRFKPMVADREVLRAVIKSARIGRLRAGATTGGTALFEDGYPRTARQQFARARQPGYARADDRDAGLGQRKPHPLTDSCSGQSRM